MGRNDYLAHSKGPWKKGIKAIRKVKVNGKWKYFYGDSKGYNKAVATSDNPYYTTSRIGKRQQKEARKKNAQRATEESLKRASNKYKVQKTKDAVSSAASAAGQKVAGTAKAAAKKVKNQKYYLSALGSTTKFKVDQGSKRLAKKANKAVARGKVKAAGSAYIAKTKSKRAAVNAKRSVSAATSYGKSAINKLFTNAKGRARLVKANASAAAIKRKQAKRANARKKA